MFNWQQLLFGFEKESIFGRFLPSEALNSIISFTIQYLHSSYLYSVLTMLLGVLTISYICKIILWIKLRTSPSKLLQIVPLKNAQQAPFSTQQLLTLLNDLNSQRTFTQKLMGLYPNYSLELDSTKKLGIRFLLRIPIGDELIVRKSLISFMPGMDIRESENYPNNLTTSLTTKIAYFKLQKNNLVPLRHQESLETLDPIAYISGNMTKLDDQEHITLQLVVSPFKISQFPGFRKIKNAIKLHEDLQDILNMNNNPALGSLGIIIRILIQVLFLPIGFLVFLASGGNDGPLLNFSSSQKSKTNKNLVQDELERLVNRKLGEQAFKTSIRLLVVGDNITTEQYIRGITSSLSVFTNGEFQMLSRHIVWPLKPTLLLHKLLFKYRLHGNSPSLLSVSEISDIYHFPYAGTTITEHLQNVLSRELPIPLSLKNNTDLDVVFGVNSYGNTQSKIGLTDEDRSRHVYLLGQTGSGKSTVLYHMAGDDIEKGRGVAVIDPHGDLVSDLIMKIPEDRTDDFIYFNPYDIKYPVGINLLELHATYDPDELELEQELVCESVISIFRKVFSKDDNADAHRIEYILRNAIYTAFTLPDATVFTVYDLLNNPDFRTKAISNLTDKNLLNFWKNEFGKAGNYQVVKMVAGVTARVGRFLFSPTAKRILEQSKSTIRFDDVLSGSKLLLCNLAEGKIGEDTSQLLGTTIIAKIHQAALRRARLNKDIRTPFYLYIDEFQNYATAPFTKLLSGGRKFGLRITIAQQSTSQQSDRNVTEVILANTGTVICFRTASPVDEELMLAQFKPTISAGEISNLPRYHFYTKLSAVEPQEPFSGTTLLIDTHVDLEKLTLLTEASRKNYAKQYLHIPTPIVKEMPKNRRKIPVNSQLVIANLS